MSPKQDLHFDSGDYAPVADRIALFYQRYPLGRIVTELVSRTEKDVVFRAFVYRSADDREPAATGWAAEREGDGDVNTVACLENTETSAIGRGLANLGFLASSTRPSREEMVKAARARTRHARSRSAHLANYPEAVSENDSAGYDALQTRANALTEALELLRSAERLGLRAPRAEAGRQLLLGTDPSPERVRRLTTLLRRWIAKKAADSAAPGDPG